MVPADEPRVSVVIPTYYRNQRLRGAIESALGQEHAVAEVIVVDGSGEAHARGVAEAYPRVDYVAQPRDEGPQAARSLGAGRAAGELVQFLDDDDRLAPSKIRRQAPLFSDDVGVVYCGLVDEAFGPVLPDPEVRGDVLERALAMNTMPCVPSTMLVDADVVNELLPLRHRHGADDTGMKIELARRTRFDYVDEALVARGKPEDPLSRSWAHVEGRKRLLSIYEGLYREVDPAVRRAAVRQTHYREGVKRLEERAWSPRAIASLARALWHTPEDRARFAAHLVGSLAGRAGLRLARRLL